MWANAWLCSNLMVLCRLLLYLASGDKKSLPDYLNWYLSNCLDITDHLKHSAFNFLVVFQDDKFSNC